MPAPTDLTPMPTDRASAMVPRLVLVPDFSGRVDFQLEMGGRTVTRLGAAALPAGAGLPTLFAPLFDDPFVGGVAMEELLADWLEVASPPPQVVVRASPSDVMLEPSGGGLELVRGGLALGTDGTEVTITRTLDVAQPFVPLGISLAFLPEAGRLVRVENPAVWDALSGCGVLEADLAPVSGDGQRFETPAPVRVPVESFNAAAIRVPDPLPQGMVLSVGGVPSPGTGEGAALALTSVVEAGAATARVEIQCSAPLPEGWESGHLSSRPVLVARSGAGGWSMVGGGCAAAAVRRGVLRLVPKARTGSGPGRLEVPAEDWRRALPDVYALCRTHGVELRYNREAVVEIDLEVAAVVGGPEAIDWFELRAEVSCAGFRLSEAEWTAVLEGRIFDPAGRGRPGAAPFVISPGSLQKLGQLEAAIVRPERKRVRRVSRDGLAVRSGRLRILDWLHLTRAGVALDLPEDDRAVVEGLLTGAPAHPAQPPAFLNAELRPYQLHGYRWLAFLYRCRFGAVLADDMGLGKTLQTIALLAGVREGRAGREPTGDPHLVVLPPTLVFNWAAELRRFYPRFRTLVYAGPRRDPNTIANHDVVLTTYDTVRRDHASLGKQAFDVVVFDEAQAVKTLASSRARAARHLRGSFVVCLTGTPLENHLGEFFAIADLALPGLLGDARTFRDEVGDDPDHPRLQRARPFLLRRTKAGLLKELPPMVESHVPLDLTETQKELYTRTVAEVRDEVAAAYARQPRAQAAITALAALTRLRQVCIAPGLLGAGLADGYGPKIDYLRAALSEVADEGHAALVFSQFTRALDLVGRALADDGLPFVRLDGKTPRDQRQGVVASFQAPGGPPVFLVSLKTGAAGLNLTRASYVFHLDPWWNPAVENQASARAHRIGQHQTVFVQRLLMRHTVEEKMMALKARKQALYDRLMSNAERDTKTHAAPCFSRDDLAFLLADTEAEP